MSYRAGNSNDQSNNTSLPPSQVANFNHQVMGVSELRENGMMTGQNLKTQQVSNFIELEQIHLNGSKLSQGRREGSAPFQNGRQNVLLKSVHGGRIPHIKESPVRKVRGLTQNQAQISPRTKKEINVNLMSHMAQNADFNNSRGADTRGKLTGAHNDSAHLHTDFPLKHRYNVQKKGTPQLHQGVKPSSDSLEKLNEIFNLTDELQKMHNMKAKRDQMIAKTQLMQQSSSIQKSHQWSDTAQILEQITQSQYNMGRSDAKQQKELQRKLMKNHFNLKNEDEELLKLKIQSKKASYVQGTLKNYEFKNFKQKESFLRDGSQFEKKHERRSSLITNGFNLRNSKLPVTEVQINQRSKTPILEGKGSPRKYNARLFPPATRQPTRERAGPNFSFKQSQDWTNLNKDLRSEAINISLSQKTRPHTKEKVQQKRTPNLQFSNIQNTSKQSKKQNINCSTSPMSAYHSRTAHSRLSESLQQEEVIILPKKNQEENNDYQNQTNIYNHLGSKFQSERSNQQHTKVMQSRISTDRYGQNVDAVSKTTQNMPNPQNLATKMQEIQNLQDNFDQFNNPSTRGGAPFLQSKELKQISGSPSPLSKTHQISITTSNCNIPNQHSDELYFFQGDRMHQVQNLGRQKMLNVNEVTSKTMTNSQSMDNQANKNIQTKTVERSDQGSQKTQMNNNIMVVNSNVQDQIQNQAQNTGDKIEGGANNVNFNSKPITYTIKKYEQEIQKLTGVKRKAMRPVEKRMLATQVFAIQAYDKMSEVEKKAKEVMNVKSSSQEKNKKPEIGETDSKTKLQKLKIMLPINQNANQPLSPDSILDDQNDLKDFGPRLVGVNLQTPVQKKSFYKQLVNAYKQKVQMKSKKFHSGNSVGIYNKIQSLSKNNEFDKMDAWTAAQILTEFPELAEELILPKQPLKVEDQLQCAPKELNHQAVKSPINSQKKSLNFPRSTDDRDREITLSSDRKNYVNKRKTPDKDSPKKLSYIDSARNSAGEAKHNNVDTRENLHSEAVQQELRKITFKIDKGFTNDREKMLTQLEQLLPDKNLSQISDKKLRQVLQNLVTQSTDRKQGQQPSSGRKPKDPQEKQFFSQRRHTQGAIKTSTFLPLKDRQAKQQFRIFVQNEKDSVIEPKGTRFFEPIRQKQIVIDKINEHQNQNDPQNRDNEVHNSRQFNTSVIESGGFSGLSQNSKNLQPSNFQRQSRQSKLSEKRTSPIRFPPRRNTKTQQKHQRGISQMYHHQSQIQHQSFVQMSPRDFIQSNERLEITQSQFAQMQQDYRKIVGDDTRNTPIHERVARVQSREAAVENVDAELKNQGKVMESSRVSMSMPSTYQGFDKIPPGSGGLMSFMNQSPFPKFEERRNSQESQLPQSIPQQYKVEDIQLVGSKQMLATRTPVSQQNNRGQMKGNGQIVTLENANDYFLNDKQIQDQGQSQMEVRANFAQKVSQVSQVTRSLHPISQRLGQTSNESRNQSTSNYSKIIPNPVLHNTDIINQQFSVRTQETESVYKQTQAQNSINKDSINPMVQIRCSNIPSTNQQFDGNHGRVISSRVHGRPETDQRQKGQSYLPEILSDQRSNDHNSDLLSPMQQVHKRATNPFDRKSAEEIANFREDAGSKTPQDNPTRQENEDDRTSGERTTIDPQIKSYTHSHNPSRIGDNQIQIINVNKIMIVDAQDDFNTNSLKNTPRNLAARQKKSEDDQNLQQNAGKIQDFLDKQLQLTKPSNKCFPQTQKRYRGSSLTANKNKSASPSQQSNNSKKQMASQSPKGYSQITKISELQKFQAGEYIKHLKRSVEKIDKKGSSKNNLDMLVAQINESCQQTSQFQTQIQSRPTKKSISPKNAQKSDQYSNTQYTFTSLGRNQMAVQNLAQNIWIQKQRQNLKKIPDLPMVIGTTFLAKNTEKQLQQQNNANFSILNPSISGRDYDNNKNASGGSIDGGEEMIKAINEVNEPESPNKVETVHINDSQVSQNRRQSNVTPTTDVLLDKIIAHAAQEICEQQQKMEKPIMDMKTPQIQNRKQEKFPMTNQSSAESVSEMSPQQVLLSREINPQSIKQTQFEIQIKEQN